MQKAQLLFLTASRPASKTPIGPPSRQVTPDKLYPYNPPLIPADSLVANSAILPPGLPLVQNFVFTTEALPQLPLWPATTIEDILNQNLDPVLQAAPGVTGHSVVAPATQHDNIWSSNEQTGAFPPSTSTSGNGRYYNIWAVQNSATMEDNTENDQVFETFLLGFRLN